MQNEPRVGSRALAVTVHRLKLSLQPNGACDAASKDADAFSIADYQVGTRTYHAVSVAQSGLTSQSTAEDVAEVVEVLVGPLLVSSKGCYAYIPGDVPEATVKAAEELLKSDALIVVSFKSNKERWAFSVQRN